MKDIKSLLNKINRETETIEKIAKFLKTKKGQKFVSNIHFYPLKDLCKMYQAPKYVRLYTSDVRNRNLIFAAIKQYNVSIPVYTPIKLGSAPRVKHQVYLTKDELRKIDAHRPKKKMGFAAQMHAYEEYMMEKFIKTHPAPTEKELAEDLFPDELMAGYKNMLYIRREYVRDVLCQKYCKTQKKRTLYRVFGVLSVTEDPATGRKHEPVISEKEIDPSIISGAYGLLTADAKTQIDVLHNRLQHLANTAPKIDHNIIKVKLYNRKGILIDVCTC